MKTKTFLTNDNVSETLPEYLSPTIDIVDVVVEHGFAQSGGNISPLGSDSESW